METEKQHGESAHIKWHPAFVQALQMELDAYREVLEFHTEYQLISEPLRIDCLVIKKPKDVVIEKNIARIFKSDNILEYKSPEDYLSVKDFQKVYAYANLYAAVTPNVDLAEITLTFIGNRHPRDLLQYLAVVRGYTVKEESSGIYTVLGDYLPIQIIESKKLPKQDNLWLKSLRNDLEVQDMNAILKEQGKRTHTEMANAYLDVILWANQKTFLEVQKMNIAAFDEIFAEAGITPVWVERGREQEKEVIARNLLKMGMSMEEIAQATELPLERTLALASE